MLACIVYDRGVLQFTRLISVAIFLLLPSFSFAHLRGESRIRLEKKENGPGQFLGTWSIHSMDLLALGVRSAVEDVPSAPDLLYEKLFPHFRLMVDGLSCQHHLLGSDYQELPDGKNLVMTFSSDCKDAQIREDSEIKAAFDLFESTNPDYLCLVVLNDGNVSTQLVLRAAEPDGVFYRGPFQIFYHAERFVREGVWHIWSGLDHLLFLLVLLLPASFRANEDRRWGVEPDKARILKNLLLTVTAFTVAHSVTLVFASLDWISLNTQFAESLIALSIFFGALNNLSAESHARPLNIAFGFGLVHGFGFSGALMGLGLFREDFLISIGSFNLGVELGQLMIVLLVLPVIFLIRLAPGWAQQMYLRGGSAIAGAFGLVLFFLRVFGFNVL